MKVIWEPEDIKVGRRYGRPDISERWMIGYRPELPSGDHFCSISLSDGMVTPAGNRDEVAEVLTAEGYLPEELL